MLLSVLDSAYPDVLLALHGLAWLEPSVPALSLATVGPPSLLRTPVRFEVLSLAYGMHWLDLPMLVPDMTELGSTLPPQSFACSDLAAFAPDISHMGSPFLLQSCSCFGLLSVVLDLVYLDSLSSLHRPSCLGLLVAASGLGRSGSCFLPLVIESLLSGSMLLLRSMSQPGLSLSVLDYGHPDLLLALRSLA